MQKIINIYLKIIIPVLYLIFVGLFLVQLLPDTTPLSILSKLRWTFGNFLVIFYIGLIIALPVLIIKFKNAAKNIAYLLPLSVIIYFVCLYFFDPASPANVSFFSPGIEGLLLVLYVMFGAYILSVPFFYAAHYIRRGFGILIILFGLIFMGSFMPVIDPSFMFAMHPTSQFHWFYKDSFAGRFIKYEYTFPVIPCVVDADPELDGCQDYIDYTSPEYSGIPNNNMLSVNEYALIRPINSEYPLAYRINLSNKHLMLGLKQADTEAKKLIEVTLIGLDDNRLLEEKPIIYDMDSEFIYIKMHLTGSLYWTAYQMAVTGKEEIVCPKDCGDGNVHWKFSKATGEISFVEPIINPEAFRTYSSFK